MKNKLNKEEQLLRSKIESVDFSYQESDWAEMDQMLGKKGFWSKFGSSLMIGLGLSVIVSSAYLINKGADSETQTSTNAKEVNETSSTPSENTTEFQSDKELSLTKTTNGEQLEETKKSLDQKVPSDLTTTSSKPILAKEEEGETISDKTATPQELNVNNSTTTTVLHEINDIKISGLLCEKTPLVLSAHTQSRTSYQYLWKVDDITQKDFSRQLSLTELSAGEHLVELQLVYEKEVVASKKQSFYLEAKPQLDFSAEDLQDPYEDLSVTLKAKSSLPANYRWEIADLKRTEEGKELKASFAKEGIYNVSLYSKSENGCESSITKSIQVKEDFDPLAYNLVIGGSNENDLFLPKAFTIRDDIFRMDIYNLSGEVIYTTLSIHEPWNGRVNNTGEFVSHGTYAWKVRIENKKGQAKEYFGKVKVFDFNR